MAHHLARTVTEAGDIALSMFRTDVETWTKDNQSPVTAADLAVDAYLRERLLAIAPDYGWLSEETRDSTLRLSRPRTWIVDPIDGTRGFIAGGPDWTISAALVEHGQPIAAALFAPVTRELFIAATRNGATRNGVAIEASSCPTLAGARISGPIPVLQSLERRYAITRMPRERSLALRLARVAAGELDMTIAGGACKDWDIAAADLILREAGGIATAYNGVPPQYNTETPHHPPLACAGLKLHAAFLQLLDHDPKAV